MTSGFLFFTNLVLLLRLGPLLIAKLDSRGAWAKASIIELLVLFLFFSPCPFLLGAALAAIAANAGSIFLLERSRRHSAEPNQAKNRVQLLLGILLLLGLSICFSHRGGIHFRPQVGQFSQWVFSWTVFGTCLRSMCQTRVMIFALGLLLASSEANLLIRWCLVDRLDILPRSKTQNKGTANIEDGGEDARGRVIGFFERALIFTFVVYSQFSAIGFVLAAKAFARFKDLDNRDFAEYVLIGTLLSSSLAMAIGFLFRLALSGP